MNYFNPEEVYIFRSLDKDNVSTKVISVVFDVNANATINISSDVSNPSDRREFVIFAPELEFEILNNPTSTDLNIIGDLSKFWYIYFDSDQNPIQQASTIPGSGGTATITCPCAQGSGDCTIDTTGSGDCKKIHCDATAICTSCNPPKVVISNIVSEKTFLLIKANNVQM